MTLHLHRSERADVLAGSLAGVLAEPLPDPIQAEVVAVPTRGIERWLTQQLAAVLGASPGRSDGVCANLEFPFPARLVERVVAAAGPDADWAKRWRPERVMWPLLDVADAAASEAWLAPFVSTLQANGGGRRLLAARRVADLFDRYSVHRPEMLTAWASGRDADAAGRSLPSELAWQAELWRRVRTEVGSESPAEVLDRACALVASRADVTDLPERVSLFGLTRLPAAHAQAIRALAVHREVHLFLLHPSPALWAAIAGAAGATPDLAQRSADRSLDLTRNPLLASWGRDARELQLVIGAAADHHDPAPPPGDTVLGLIQSAIRGNAPPPAPPVGGPDPRPLLADTDRSIVVHACHGQARQVEILRDAILHALEEDPSLEPRDVIVMCPDVEAFAPLVKATFEAGGDRGADPADPAGANPAASQRDAGPSARVDLRVRLADRSLRQTNPVLGVVAALLELADARLTASEVLDLAGRGPVRARFGLDDDELDQIEVWIGASGIRWGLDAAHRRAFALPDMDNNTWHAGMRRLLVGAAMSEDGYPLVGGVLPLDDVDSGQLDLAGRTAELVGRLAASIDALTGPHTLKGWAGALFHAQSTLCLVTEADRWQTAEVGQLLDDLLDEASCGDANRELSLVEVRALLADRLQGRPTRANFRTGHLTVCTLVPMRSVPHRVVCLLGIDDGAFPRRADPRGDDLLDRAPRVGDRDPRGEDRQLWLDAVLAATDRLIVTYQARDPRSNARLPPAVPLGELLDAIDATVRTGGTDVEGRQVPARARVTVHHPLQPWDPRNYRPCGLARGVVGGDGPWGFDQVNLAGAAALDGERLPPPPFLDAPLPPLEPQAVGLDQLVRFVRHPVGAFVRQRLGAGRPTPADGTMDTLTVELDPLGRWAVGDRLLRARLEGASVEDACRAEAARGSLPPDSLGRAVLDEIAPVVEKVLRVARRLGLVGDPPETADVAVDLGGGWSVVGTVGGLRGGSLGTVSYAGVRPAHRLETWVRLLTLTAARPSVPWHAVLVGQRRGEADLVALGPVGGEEATPQQRAAAARRALSAIMDLYQRGMCEPLPLYCATSEAWAGDRRRGRNPIAAARKAWETERGPQAWDREDRDPFHRYVLGGVVPFDHLLSQPPRPSEGGPGWDGDEASRFGRYAVALWGDLLAHERTMDTRC